jgi:hypothetical protein
MSGSAKKPSSRVSSQISPVEDSDDTQETVEKENSCRGW